MRKLLLCILIVGAAIFAKAQVGKQFPTMDCSKLDGKEHLVLPLKETEKFTLIGLAFSKKSEADLRTWYKPIYDKFIAKPTNVLIADDPYDVELFFVPMFTGVNAAAAGAASKQMKKGVSPVIGDHILVFKGKLKEYKAALNMGKKDVPYFFVLDKDGKIAYSTSGPYLSLIHI